MGQLSDHRAIPAKWGHLAETVSPKFCVSKQINFALDMNTGAYMLVI